MDERLKPDAHYPYIRAVYIYGCSVYRALAAALRCSRMRYGRTLPACAESVSMSRISEAGFMKSRERMQGVLQNWRSVPPLGPEIKKKTLAKHNSTVLKFASHHFLLYAVYICQNSLNYTYTFKCYQQNCKLGSLLLGHPVVDYSSFTLV